MIAPSKPAIPRTAADITPAWLTQALAAGGQLDGGRVVSLEAEEIGLGTGFLGIILRLTPLYEGAAGAPRSLIAKLPTAVETTRALAEQFGFYATEIRFYQQLAADTTMRIPRCYWAAMDQASSAYALLLEDASPAKVGDQQASCSLEQARLIVRNLAAHHAAWWESDRLSQFPWLLRPFEPPVAEVLHALYQDSLERAFALMGERVRSDFREIGTAIGRHLPQVYARLAQSGTTLVHGDYRLENMLFGAPGSADELVVIDWQLVGVASGLYDLSYFMGQNLLTAMRREHEQELVQLYRDTVTEHGVEGLSFERCWDGYRSGLLAITLLPVNGLGTFDGLAELARQAEGAERATIEATMEAGLALTATMLERNVAAILDTGAAELLPA